MQVVRVLNLVVAMSLGWALNGQPTPASNDTLSREADFPVEHDQGDDLMDRLTTESRMVLFFARSAVSQHGGARVEVAHLMLGILAAAPDAVTKVATVSGPVEHIRERAMKMLGAENERPGKGVDVPLSKDCQRALERGAREASALNSRDIRPEHLLLALLNDEAVSPMLGEIGVSRSSVLAFLKEK